MGVLGKLQDGVCSMASSTATAGQSIANSAISSAVSQLMNTMKYASQKIAEADEDLPEGTMLRVSASALLVELSLEVPVKSLKDSMGESHGQDSTGRQDEVVREEVPISSDADDPDSGTD